MFKVTLYVCIFFPSLVVATGSATSESKFVVQSDVEELNNDTAEVRPPLPFSCWKCYSTSENDSCFTMNTTEDDDDLVEQCGQYQQHCKVQRVWYIIGVTNEQHNFSIQRSCSSECSPFFNVMGDRTKIYSSASCCQTSFCNTGSSADDIHPFSHQLHLGGFFLLAILLNVQGFR